VGQGEPARPRPSRSRQLARCLSTAPERSTDLLTRTVLGQAAHSGVHTRLRPHLVSSPTPPTPPRRPSLAHGYTSAPRHVRQYEAQSSSTQVRARPPCPVEPRRQRDPPGDLSGDIHNAQARAAGRGQARAPSATEQLTDALSPLAARSSHADPSPRLALAPPPPARLALLAPCSSAQQTPKPRREPSPATPASRRAQPATGRPTPRRPGRGGRPARTAAAEHRPRLPTTRPPFPPSPTSSSPPCREPRRARSSGRPPARRTGAPASPSTSTGRPSSTLPRRPCPTFRRKFRSA